MSRHPEHPLRSLLLLAAVVLLALLASSLLVSARPFPDGEAITSLETFIEEFNDEAAAEIGRGLPAVYESRLGERKLTSTGTVASHLDVHHSCSLT